MGAKAPSKLKLRRPTFKCNHCSRKFLSAQALKTHQYCMHKIDGKAAKNAKQTKVKGKLKTLLGKEVKKVQLSKLKDNVGTRVSARKQSASSIEPLESPTVSDVRKIEFECPQCFKLFSVYFSAYRHIQKSHCVNITGQKVPPDSPHLIKPVRVELCIKCNMRVRPNESHCCSTAAFDSSVLVCDYACVACKHKFSSMQMFDVHVSSLHCDDVVSLFFPETKQFETWKDEMEKTTHSKYTMFGKLNTKLSYRCSFVPTLDSNDQAEDISYFCPSSIMVTEYSKGTQVHFYKQHFGHTCKSYKLPNLFKKFAIKSFKPGSSAVDSINADLYTQFKKIMDFIVLDTAKVDIACLKILIGKALEMSTLINSFLEDGEDVVSSYLNNKSMTDTEITEALKSFAESRVRSRSTDSLQSNRDTDTPVILNTFSMANEEPSKKKPKTSKDPPIKKIQSPNSVSSFNDSYKDFVDKNFKVADKNFKAPDKNFKVADTNVKVEFEVPIIENKINIKSDKDDTENNNTSDIKVNKPTSKKDKLNTVTDSKNNKNVTKNKNDNLNTSDTKNNKNLNKSNNARTIEAKKKPLAKTKSENANISLNKNKNSKINDDTIKAKINKSAVKIKNENDVGNELLTTIKKVKTEKKKVMKTKIGQFKPSLSPKKPVLEERRSSTGIEKIKVDFDYEVKEQDNDCNILILKI